MAIYAIVSGTEMVGLPPFIYKVIALYSTTSAKFLVNGTISDHEMAHSKGFPSPLLFAIVIKHLAQAIRGNPDIHGV